MNNTSTKTKVITAKQN